MSYLGLRKRFMVVIPHQYLMIKYNTVSKTCLFHLHGIVCSQFLTEPFFKGKQKSLFVALRCFTRLLVSKCMKMLYFLLHFLLL